MNQALTLSPAHRASVCGWVLGLTLGPQGFLACFSSLSGRISSPDSLQVLGLEPGGSRTCALLGDMALLTGGAAPHHQNLVTLPICISFLLTGRRDLSLARQNSCGDPGRTAALYMLRAHIHRNKWRLQMRSGKWCGTGHGGGQWMGPNGSTWKSCPTLPGDRMRRGLGADINKGLL